MEPNACLRRLSSRRQKEEATKRIALMIILGTTFAVCETVEGVGRDVENTGEAIQSAANS
ncbi:entericidin A/B family lipoprotein [uncultured Tateyamaria sp.]|uniref:entericidin A/B family lipoprotein n=1 Tax=uncultured Tateyamaria sp. TaxID=455651 RepID=UPI0026218073|nr:entericidin A/B family lipoprotein [uncultured Tateyamaria sp.]